MVDKSNYNEGSPRLEDLMERIGALLWDIDARRTQIKTALKTLIDHAKKDKSLRKIAITAAPTLIEKLRIVKRRYLELRNIEGPVLGAFTLGEEGLDKILRGMDERLAKMEKDPIEAGYHNTPERRKREEEQKPFSD